MSKGLVLPGSTNTEKMGGDVTRLTWIAVAKEIPHGSAREYDRQEMQDQQPCILDKQNMH